MILDYLKKYEKESIITSLILVIVSIFLILKPEIALSTAVAVFGVIFLLDGIVNIISYIFATPEVRAFSTELIIGILLAIIGTIILCNNSLFVSIIPIMIGIWLIIRSIVKFQLSINLKSALYENWGWLLISSLIMLMFGIIIIAHPFGAIFTMTRFLGIILAISQICDIIESIYILSKVK